MNGGPRHVHHHGPLAGVTAGVAGVLFALVLLLLAWHRVAGQVSMGVEILVYAVIAAGVALLAYVLWYVHLWVRHRARNPELLARPRETVEPARSEAVTWAAEPLPLERPASQPAAQIVEALTEEVPDAEA